MSAAETDDLLQAAVDVTDRLGVTRATPITAFDRIGVPVWSTVRPRAAGLVVNGGKGLDDVSAQVSARLECLEQIAAETPPAVADCTAMSWSEAKALEPELMAHLRVPVTTESHDLERRTTWIRVHDAWDQRATWAPVEAVAFPVPAGTAVSRPVSTTCGLGCGVSFEKAFDHGLREVIERHVSTLVRVGALTPARVDPRSMPEELGRLLQKVSGAGLDVVLRATQFGAFWFFDSLITEPGLAQTRFANGGSALSLTPLEAAMAAVLEAIQSRASYIHGAREDLETKASAGAVHGASDAHHARLMKHYSTGGRVSFPAAADTATRRGGSQEVLLRVQELGFADVSFFEYSGSYRPFTVVRVLVPAAEDFTTRSPYLGSVLLSQLRRQRHVPQRADR